MLVMCSGEKKKPFYVSYRETYSLSEMTVFTGGTLVEAGDANLLQETLLLKCSNFFFKKKIKDLSAIMCNLGGNSEKDFCIKFP